MADVVEWSKKLSRRAINVRGVFRSQGVTAVKEDDMTMAEPKMMRLK